MGKSTISMAISSSYVSLPEGIVRHVPPFLRFASVAAVHLRQRHVPKHLGQAPLQQRDAAEQRGKLLTVLAAAVVPQGLKENHRKSRRNMLRNQEKWEFTGIHSWFMLAKWTDN